MKRELFKQLQAWKNNKKRKPLILMGARQVGKTTLLKQLGASEYQQYAYLNFEEKPALRSLFEASLEPDVLLKTLKIETNIDIQPGSTLIIFDEIQECPNALNSLKYFCEEAREYHICAAGSLLGVKLEHTKGFPVGKVNFLNLYPLSFPEFLEAVNEVALRQYLESIENIEPLPSIFHEKLLQYLKYYLFIGGMPEAVAEYIDSKDLQKVRSIHKEVLRAYSLDFAKHAKEKVMEISLVWNAIPSQLAKENKKFIYSAVRKGARAKDFEASIQWLLECGLIHKTYNVTTPKLPLDAYAEFDFFKIYVVDVGLLGAMTDLSPKVVIQGDQLFQEFRGSLVENYVAQELARCQYGLYYWTSEGKAELDFVVRHESHLFPLEIKSGTTDKKKSLRVYRDKYHPPVLIRSSPMNLKKDGEILNIPLYLMGELNRLVERAKPSSPYIPT